MYNIIIVGGGLAGLVSALHLSIKGQKVLLIEKHKYPKHKVCGEYISNEVIPYLNALGFNPFDYGAKKILYLTLSTRGSSDIRVKLPYGGFSISRYCLDWELSKKATQNGVIICHENVTDIQFKNGLFEVLTSQNKKYTAALAIGSFGKRSNLDIKMKRNFIQKPSPYLAVKAHYKGNFPENEVGLHNFEGGYCGISKVENDNVNVCYITDFKSFRQYRNIDDFQKKVLSKNNHLKNVFDTFEIVFKKPLSISQISFSKKQPVEFHILMCGDSAGMIHPLAGNGMTMAIRSAQMASLQILKYRKGLIKNRFDLEKRYTQTWNKEFRTRLMYGGIIAKLFRLNFFSELLMLFLKLFPKILPSIIEKTHGKEMKAEL